MKKLNLSKTNNFSQLWPMLCFFIILSACGPSYVTPLFQDAEFGKMKFTEPFYLMPVIDLRVDKTKNFQLDNIVRQNFSSTFKTRGYGPIYPIIDRKFVESLVEDDFTNPDSSFLSTLGPEEARWILFPLLHNFQSKKTFGSSANVEVTGYVVDKKLGKIVWHHKGIGRAGQGGLIGMIEQSAVSEEALHIAFSKLASAIPKKKVPSGSVTKITRIEEQRIKNLKPDKSKALVYFVRTSIIGKLIEFGTTCDENLFIGASTGKQFIYAFLETGMHKFVTMAENDSELFLKLEAGKIYFIKQRVKLGKNYARCELELADEKSGREMLDKCKLSDQCPAYYQEKH